MAIAVRAVAEKTAGREFWDSNPCGGAWESYAAFLTWYRLTEPYMYRIVGGYDWRGLHVLEVGCGQGVLANHLASTAGASVVAMDMSRASLERAAHGARELGCANQIRLLQADAERLPFGDRSFDAVVSFGVLHHTPDTAGAIRELRRVLRPGGRAIVMLYRTGNPKWVATRLLRAIGRRSLRRPAMDGRAEGGGGPVADTRGTALQELFGVPTLKAFSNAEARAMFDGFDCLSVSNYQPGFRRLADVVKPLGAVAPFLAWIDRTAARAWGFYQVVEARRPGV